MIIYHFILFPSVGPKVLEADSVPLLFVVTSVKAPSCVQVQIPGTCEWVASHGKRDFADVVKGTNPEMGRLPWARCNHKPLKAKPFLGGDRWQPSGQSTRGLGPLRSCLQRQLHLRWRKGPSGGMWVPQGAGNSPEPTSVLQPQGTRFYQRPVSRRWAVP